MFEMGYSPLFYTLEKRKKKKSFWFIKLCFWDNIGWSFNTMLVTINENECVIEDCLRKH